MKNILILSITLLCITVSLQKNISAQVRIFETGLQSNYSTTKDVKVKDAGIDENSLAKMKEEIEILKQRLDVLESRNRAMAEIITELRTTIDKGINKSIAETQSDAELSESTKSQSSKNVESVRWLDIIGEGNKFRFYGFMRLDLDIDSQRPNNAQIPLNITSSDLQIGKDHAGNFSMHPRLTRFGVDFAGPRIKAMRDGKLSGKLEIDFEN